MEDGATDPRIRVGAANLAAWHDSSIRALGLTTSSGRWWWTAPTPRPWIYFTAIALDQPGSPPEQDAFERELAGHLADPRGAFQAVCETYGRFDLDRLAGEASSLVHRTTGRWYVRVAPVDEPLPDLPADQPADQMADQAGGAGELEIIQVREADDLHDYERATCAAFRAPPPVAPFEIHAPGILDDPAMHVLLARVDGEVAGGAMAYVTDDVVGIYGVGTVPAHRGRGCATALTTHALGLAPDRPAVLQPSAEAEALYHRLGFVDIGGFTHWA